jgi:hypothetical protein
MDKRCSICGSEWIFKGPKGIHHLCEDCYNDMNKEVIDYHNIQKDAHKHVIEGDVENAILLLHLVQEKRNNINKYFNNTLNEGHYWFANDFIPSLIIKLSNKRDTPSKIWDDAFATLTN